MWLELELDQNYFMQYVNHNTCLNYCYDLNLERYKNSIPTDEYRMESMACQANCLNKMNSAHDILGQIAKSHPRGLKNMDEFAAIQEEYKKI